MSKITSESIYKVNESYCLCVYPSALGCIHKGVML